MELLVEGIFQCSQCKKIIKEAGKTSNVEEQKEVKKGVFQDANAFPKLNAKFEILEKGIIVEKTKNRLFAVLICHSAYLQNEKYVRFSWWKNQQHAGMLKIYDKDVLNNIFEALERIDKTFDDIWIWSGSFGKKTEQKSKEELEKKKKLDIIKYRILENRTCPKCQNKMDKKKSHYECQYCGEIVILEGYNQPVFNISNTDLDLKFHANFPINFYLPVSGITIKWLMGEWKALIVIYSKDNPNKKWLRFYWWVRDLSNILKYGRREMGSGIQMGWKAQRGVSSPNIFDKKLIKPLINAVKKISVDLKWEIKKNKKK